MIRLESSGEILGATVHGIDLAQPLGDADFQATLESLGQYGVLRFPNQRVDAAALRDFSQRFGSIQGPLSGQFAQPGVPEVGILSNVVENGRPIGLADAGQDWHTDMSYSRTIAFANVLYGIKIPRRNGKVLGNTEFCGMHAAYQGLSNEMKSKLDGMTVLHDFSKFWDKMRMEKGSKRPP